MFCIAITITIEGATTIIVTPAIWALYLIATGIVGFKAFVHFC